MKIINPSPEIEYSKFSELEIGDVFEFSGDVYIKTKSEEDMTGNCIRLKDGQPEGFLDLRYPDLRLVKAELHIIS